MKSVAGEYAMREILTIVGTRDADLRRLSTALLFTPKPCSYTKERARATVYWSV
jgi:hypothetical protein